MWGSDMTDIEIDLKKLLGYRLIDGGVNEALMSAKTGDKPGEKPKLALSATLGEKLGGKLGAKEGKKPPE